MNRPSNTFLVLACLAATAAAQKSGPQLVKGNAPGNYGPPPGTSFVQLLGGSNDCAVAAVNDTITGVGTFAVNTAGATTGVAPQPVGQTTIKNDVWLYWTAPTSGVAQLETCGGVGVDTKAAAWAANNGTACPSGTHLAYNDDACGLETRITWPVAAGSSYFLQLGAYTEGVTYSGTFTLAVFQGPSNDACSAPIVIGGPGVFNFDNGYATTGTEGQAEALCLYATSTAIYKDSWWTWTPTQTGSVEVSTCGQVLGGTDTRIAIYDGSGCPASSAIACNDDAGSACAAAGFNSIVNFNAVCGQTYTIQVGSYAAGVSLSGTFMVTESAGTQCGPPATPVCFGDGAGAPCPCGNVGAAGNGCASSVNANGGNLSSSGAASIASDTLTLLGSGMPSSSALYFQGSAVLGSGNGVTFGDGLRCAGGTIIRLGTKTNVAGVSQYPVGADVPISIRGSNSAGAFRVYQVWYRNAAAFCTASTFNLTNAVSLTWAL